MPTACACRHHRPTAASTLAALGGKALFIPKDGWTKQRFAVYGAAMLKALVRQAYIAKAQAMKPLALAARNQMLARVEQVIAKVQRLAENPMHHRGAVSFPCPPSNRSAFGRIGAKLTVNLDLPGGDVWNEALNQVFEDAGIEAVASYMPPIQSVMAQGYGRTTVLLGGEPARDAAARMARMARQVAEKITSVDETTRDGIAAIVREGIEEGSTLGELIAELRDGYEDIAAWRSARIARTELSNAWTRGSAEAYKECDMLETVSVIGCTAEEPEWEYNGEPTCNYAGLPVAELDAFLEAGFHPNHTGTLVPDEFKSEW